MMEHLHYLLSFSFQTDNEATIDDFIMSEINEYETFWKEIQRTESQVIFILYQYMIWDLYVMTKNSDW